MRQPRWIWTVVAGLFVLAFAVLVFRKIAHDRDAVIDGTYGAVPVVAPSSPG